MKKFHFYVILIYCFLLFLFYFNSFVYSADMSNGKDVEKINGQDLNSEKLFVNSDMEYPFSFNISALSKIELGEGTEFVYSNGEVLSELKWHLKPAGGFGFNAEVFFNPGIHAFFSSAFFLKAVSGKMIDRDFALKDYADKPTHNSEHKNILKNGYNIEFSLGWLMPLADFFIKNSDRLIISIEPSVGAYFLKHMWLASIGYIQYAGKGKYVTDDVPKIQQLEDAVQYTQMMILPNIGIAVIFDLPKDWKLQTSIRACPQVKAYCKDEHFLRDLIFYDTFEKNGFSFHFNFFAEKNISQIVKIFSRLDYSTVFSQFGKTKEVDKNFFFSFLPKGAAGTKLDSLSLDIGAGISIPQQYKIINVK